MQSLYRKKIAKESCSTKQSEGKHPSIRFLHYSFIRSHIFTEPANTCIYIHTHTDSQRAKRIHPQAHHPMADRQTEQTREKKKDILGWSSTSLWHCPIDEFLRSFYGASLAMQAVLCIDLQPLLSIFFLHIFVDLIMYVCMNKQNHIILVNTKKNV